MRVESIGGGDIVIEGARGSRARRSVYPESSFAEIAQYCRWRYITLP